MPMAVLFYFVVRAGFLSSGVSAGEVNRFGIAAVAGLVGMFSVKAGDKLKELFDTLFKTETAAKRHSYESCFRSCKASSQPSKSSARNLWMWSLRRRLRSKFGSESRKSGTRNGVSQSEGA